MVACTTLYSPWCFAYNRHSEYICGVNEFRATGIHLLHSLESWVSGAQHELTCKSSHLLHGLWLLLFKKIFLIIAGDPSPPFQTQAHGVVQICTAIF